jgi:hypothetical protein
MRGGALATDHAPSATVGDFDFNRAAPAASRDRPFKQWVHVTVWHPKITLVFNFSSVHAGPDVDHRLTVLVYTSGVAGHVRRFEARECRLPVGRSTIVFGPNSIRRMGAEYDVSLFEPALDLRATLTLRALTRTATVQGARVDAHSDIGWSVVPRLAANGRIQHGGRVHELEEAPAYRDRNWGCFAFGEVAWDWLYALPSDPAVPWAAVVSRLTDRSRSRVWQQALLVWEGREVLATFRDRDVELTGAGRVRGALLTIPPALAICSGGEATDVPAVMDVRARSGRGSVHLSFESRMVARIVAPNEARAGTTPIHESLGACRMTGTLEGRPVSLDGHGFLECLHA